MYAPLHIHIHVHARTAHSVNSISSQRRQISCAVPHQFHQHQSLLRLQQGKCRPVGAREGVSISCSSGLVVREQSTGVEFPEVTTLWEGDKMRSMGAGVRAKKFAFVPVKVYAVTVYVEAEKAARELGVRQRGGFFDDNRDEDFTLALVDGAFAKALVVQLVRKVEGKQFYEALEEALAPRLRLAGDTGSLTKFGDFLSGRSLEKGTGVVLFYRVEGVLEVAVLPPGTTDYSLAKPELRVESPMLCRALFEVYMGSESVVPDARAAWAAGARTLLASEQVRRDTRKSGS
ncbi:probable chalcone-flavonone isomerase [Coccomyxa sp. Obi]|nr:probable chalcone-flavonone isomerase [Coccomyxa sp. Obi]